MKKLTYTCYSLLVLTPFYGVNASKRMVSKTDSPNIVLIMTDDQGWGDVQAIGNELIQTPVLNSLYRESAVFERFYATPLSATTRASLLTGRYHLRTGSIFVQNGLENMNPEETTLAEILKKMGYTTGCFGKWHNGAYFPFSPNGQGFDEFLGFTSGHWANYFNPELQHNEKQTQGKGYITDIFTDAALQFIESNKNRPFFCYVPYNAPHSPYQVPDKYFDKYDKSLSIQNSKDRAVVASVYGMIENVDDNIGRIITRLDELKLRENTIIVFLTDNGPAFKNVPRYNGNLRGQKGEVHEGGVRVPCIINWKGKIGASSIQQPTSVIDILPTMLDLCGVNNAETKFPIDGLSLKNVILNKTNQLPKRNLYTHRYTGKMSPVTGALRTHDLCLTVVKDSVLLFDLSNDPYQNRNLFDRNNPEHKSLLNNYENWFNQASQNINTSIVVPVGYKQVPEVRMVATEGRLSGKLNVVGAPNDNWVNGFASKADSLILSIDVKKNGNYQFEVEYTNASKSNNITLSLCCSNSVLSVNLPQFITKRLPDHDRVDRYPCAYPQTWGRLKLGKIRLSPGIYRLKMFAENSNSENSIQLKRIIVTAL